MLERKIVYRVEGQLREIEVPAKLTDAEVWSVAYPLTGIVYEREVTPWQGVHPRTPDPVDLAEQGRRLASEREDLIAQGTNPADLAVPLHPNPTIGSDQM